MKKFLLLFSVLLGVGFVSPVFAGNPPDQGKSTIVGTSAPADGLTSSTVTVTLKDANGNAVTSADMVVITSLDSTAVFDPGSKTLTEGTGIFTVTMKAK